MAEELNKLDLLIKVMKMTTATEDNMSLVAMRKANAMLAAEGWDWERLLKGKVKVIADPFAGTPAPPMHDFKREPQYASRPAPPPPPPRPAPRPQTPPPFRARPAAGPQNPPWPQQTTPNAGMTKENIYSGNCRDCTNYVGVRAGKVVKQGSAWKLFCVACASKSKNQPRSTNLDDILGGVP